MCNENSNVENVMAELETAAEQLSMVQQNVNSPLFDLLFKLVNYPQAGANISGAKVKVLHTYAHRFMEFYMTECPDGVSIHTVNPSDVYEIASKLRSLGDGLSRLLVYLGMNSENEQFVECVDSLAVAYDAFAVVVAKTECSGDPFDEDCDGCQGVGCPRFCHCEECECDCEDEDEDDTSWVNEYREDDDAQEYDPEEENTQSANAKEASEEKVKDEDLDELAKLLTDALFRVAGIPIPNSQKQEVNKPKKPYEKPEVEVRTYAPAKRIVVREVVPGFWKFGL